MSGLVFARTAFARLSVVEASQFVPFFFCVCFDRYNKPLRDCVQIGQLVRVKALLADRHDTVTQPGGTATPSIFDASREMALCLQAVETYPSARFIDFHYTMRLLSTSLYCRLQLNMVGSS